VGLSLHASIDIRAPAGLVFALHRRLIETVAIMAAAGIAIRLFLG